MLHTCPVGSLNSISSNFFSPWFPWWHSLALRLGTRVGVSTTGSVRWQSTTLSYTYTHALCHISWYTWLLPSWRKLRGQFSKSVGWKQYLYNWWKKNALVFKSYIYLLFGENFHFLNFTITFSHGSKLYATSRNVRLIKFIRNHEPQCWKWVMCCIVLLCGKYLIHVQTASIRA